MDAIYVHVFVSEKYDSIISERIDHKSIFHEVKIMWRK